MEIAFYKALWTQAGAAGSSVIIGGLSAAVLTLGFDPAMETITAEAQEITQQEAKLKEVTVTATRAGTDINAVPAAITTLGRETLARDARRFGATRVNIRGIEDNRVIQMVDGVRLPNFYNDGGPINFTLARCRL